MVVFTTGLGTPTGNPIVPVIKITGNRHTYANMRENMDFDASPVISGEDTIAGMGKKLLEQVVAVSNGQLTSAETFGFGEIAISRICNYV